MQKNKRSVEPAATAAGLLDKVKQSGRISLDLHGGGAGAGHSLPELVLAEREERAAAAGMGAAFVPERMRGAGVRGYRGDKSRDDKRARVLADEIFAARSPRCAEIVEAVNEAARAMDEARLIGHLAAGKQAGRVRLLRGVVPSSSSVADAGDMATLAVLTARQFSNCMTLGARVPVARALLTADGAADVFECGADEWRAAGSDLARLERRWAARAAWSSLVNWGSGGTGADGDGARALIIGGEEGAAKLAVIPDESAKARGVMDWFATRAARWSAARGLYRLAMIPFAGRSGLGSGRTLAAARARGRVLASVALGDDIERAAARGGFASVQTFIQSAQAAGLSASLRAFLISAADFRGVAFKLGRKWNRAQAVRALRGIRAASGQMPWLVGYGQTQRATTPRARASITANLTKRRAVRDYRAGVAAAAFNDARLRASIAQAADTADKLWAGLQRRQWRNLASIAGVQTDDGKRRGAAKPDGSMIRRSRGSIGDKSARAARRADAASVVSLSIGGRRPMDCAKLA